MTAPSGPSARTGRGPAPSPGRRRASVGGGLVAAFGGFASFQLLLSAMPAYAVRSGAGPSGAGVLTAVLMAATLVVQPGTPWLFARLGHRRSLAVSGLLLGAPCLALPFAGSLPVLAALAVPRGLGFGVFVVAGVTFTAELFPPERRGRAVGWYGAVVGVAGVLGAPLGIALARREAYGTVFALAAGAAALVVAGGFGFPRATPTGSWAWWSGLRRAKATAPRDRFPGSGRATPTRSRAWWSGLRRSKATASQDRFPGSGRGAPTRSRAWWSGLRRATASARTVCRSGAAGPLSGPLLVEFASTTAYGVVYTFLPLTTPYAPRALLVAQVATVLARLGAGRLIDRYGGRPVLGPAVVVTALGTAAGAVGGRPVLLLAGAALFGAGFGAVQSATLVVALRAAEETPAGLGLAGVAWNIAFDAGTGAGSLLGGPLLAAGGPAALFPAVSAVLVAVLVVDLRAAGRAVAAPAGAADP